jgi:hypothetical protein
MRDLVEYTIKRIIQPLPLKPTLMETLSYATWEGFTLPDEFHPFWHATYIPGSSSSRIRIELLHEHAPIKTKIIHWATIEPIGNKVFLERTGQLSLF